MLKRSRAGLFSLLALILAAFGGGHARADGVALLDPARPMTDVTPALIRIIEPRPLGADKIAPPEARFIDNANAYSGWLALSVKNSGTRAMDRVLVFAHPSLAHSGLRGAPLAAPRILAVRYVERELPVALPLAGPANRFATLGIHLEAGASETIAVKVASGSRAIAVQAWEPQALARFDTYLLLAIGLFWGILFVGIGLLFALRVLSGGPGLIAGGFLALAALLFEGASFGFGGASWTLALSRIGLDPAAVLRPLSLTLVAFFGVAFLRKVFELRDETPLLDVVLRLFQYTLLVALPMIFVWAIGPFAARAAAASAILVTGASVFLLRKQAPETLQLVPPGWLFLMIAGTGALAVSWLGFASTSAIIELALHGVFVIGILLLVFAAAVRASAQAIMVEPALAAHQPASAPPRAELELPRPSVAPSSYQGLWDWSIGEDRLYVSPSVEAMMGLPEGSLGGRERNWSQRIVEGDRSVYADTLNHYMGQGNSSFAVEFRVRHQDGGVRWVQLRATGLAGEDGRAARLIGVVTDITAAKVAEEQVVREATEDTLTGLGNRAYILSHVDWLLTQFREHPAHDASGRVVPPALLFVDLDRFKAVNDGLGHAAGDQLLIELARLLRGALGAGDALARAGNDEFVIVLSPEGDGARGSSSPEEIAEFIKDLCAQPLELAGQLIYPSVTIGIVRFEPRHRSAEEILAEAETAMRRARKRGAGEIETFTERRAERRPPAISLESDLRQAVAREELYVLYQPVIALKGGGIAGFEALLRWQHRERGILGPEHFIAIAEETGLIVPIGRFVLARAARQLGDWQVNFPLRRALFVTVNVSSRQLLRSDFAHDVAEVLDSVSLAPGSLKLEVTESMIFDDPARVAELLATIRAKGVALALDDYGRGFSSLSRLKALPLTTVKIDKEFVHGAGDKGQADAILRSTIAMAHEMKLDIVCEGVERGEQAASLEALGADYAQGFFYGEPLTAGEAQRFIAKNWRLEPRKIRAG